MNHLNLGTIQEASLCYLYQAANDLFAAKDGISNRIYYFWIWHPAILVVVLLFEDAVLGMDYWRTFLRIRDSKWIRVIEETAKAFSSL